MNQSKKLGLSKETLRCLDDQDLTGVAGGWGREGGGHNNNNSDGCNQSGICASNFGNQQNSCLCQSVAVCNIYVG
jgi:hypothetical protein